MGFSGPIEGRVAIAELNASYGDLISARDGAAWANLWAEDAVWDHPRFGLIEGRSAIRRMGDEALDNLPFVQFMSSLGSLAVRDDRAEGRVWVVEYTSKKTGEHFRVCGVYQDSYVNQDGIWRFERRSYQYLQRAAVQTVAVM